MKELQQECLNKCVDKPPILTTSSQLPAIKLNEVDQLNEQQFQQYQSTHLPDLVNHLKNLEDTVIKIYYQQKLVKEQRKFNKKVSIKNTMNYLTKQNQSCIGGNSNNNGSNNVSNKGSTNSDVSSSTTIIQLEDTDADKEVLSLVATHDERANSDVESIGESFQSFVASSSSNQKVISDNRRNSNDENFVEYHMAANDPSFSGGQTTSIFCQKFTNNDVKLLIMELKRKVDYTEKMNWLCKC